MTNHQQLNNKILYFNWLQITDIHIGVRDHDWLLPKVTDIFLDDLEKLCEKCGPLDLVLLTGDLTQRGEAEQFQQLDEFLERLWNHFNKELGCQPKLLAIPGNHDLVRPNENDDILKRMQAWENDENLRETFWNQPDSWYRQLINKAFQNYTTWWHQQPHKIDNYQLGLLPGDFSASFKKELAGETIQLGIVGLNTAFLQLTGGNYQGKLALHTRQFNACCENRDWLKQQQAYLLMTHHPSAWLNTESQQHLSQNMLATTHCVAHLCGHLHTTANYEIIKGATTERIWQGRSLFSAEQFGTEHEQRSHGYSIGQLEVKRLKNDKLNGNLRFYPREYRQGRMVPDYDAPISSSSKWVTRSRSIKLLEPPTQIEPPNKSNSGENHPQPSLEPSSGNPPTESRPQPAPLQSHVLALKLLEQLSRSQFEKVIFLYEVPEHHLAGSAQTQKAIEVIRYAIQKEGKELRQLLKVIYQVASHLAR